MQARSRPEEDIMDFNAWLEENKALLIVQAQEHARKHGLSLGATVAHPDDELMYGLEAIEGDIAVVGLSPDDSPTGNRIEKRFPVKELFSPNTLQGIADDARTEALAKEIADYTGWSVATISIG